MKKIHSVMRYYESYGAISLFNKILGRLFKSAWNNQFSSISRKIRNHIRDQNYLDVRYIALAEGVSYVFGYAVKGHIAEFGTMTGRSAVALATAVSLHEHKYIGDSRSGKKLFLFDSFEGLPEARFEVDKASHHVANGFWKKGTCKGLSEVGLSDLISKYLDRKKYFVIKGWFKDTVPKIPDGTLFSMIHIDGDLYESTIDVLDNLFERKMVANGAMIFFDDFDCNAADPLLGERLAWSELTAKYSINFSDMGAYSDACHRFIIHSYS